ncbi:MAG: polymer-forming cytoskeletal protein [Chrysiogenales bacterium]|nr:MAG: polymer-forming cytoskeletal protein [Chrysiogenales bacterium]
MAVFNQKKPALAVNPFPAATTGSQSSVVGKTLLIKGEIFSDDEILIEGRIQGKISVKNRLVIGADGVVEADIEAREVVIRGKVTGNVKGSQRVEIVPAGTLHGNIQSPRVVIADAGFFEGSIEMHLRDDKNSAKEEKQAEIQQQPAGNENSNTHKPPRK